MSTTKTRTTESKMSSVKKRGAKTGWRRAKLENKLELIIDHRGKTPKKLGGKWSNSGVPAISAKNVKGGCIVNEGSIRYVSQELYDRWMPVKLEWEDILLTSEAPLGEMLFLGKHTDYCLSQRLFALRTKKKELNSRFLYYYLQSRDGKHALMSRISGTAAQGIRQAELRKVEIAFPEDINEQKRIADTLSAFDEKIENNNRIIKTLEEMAQAIFKEWFVKFRFPGHEKAKFVDSELGKIPEGWEVKKLEEVAKLNKGLSYSSEEIADGDGVPMINLANFRRGGGFKAEGTKHFSGKYKSHHQVRPGQIILAMTDLTSNREVIGHPARVPNNIDTAVISLDVCSIGTKEKYEDFLYHLMLEKSFSNLMANCATGTNVAHLRKTVVEGYQFVFPDGDTLGAFSRTVQSMFGKQGNLSAENQKLATMRDLLLPKLMNGEIRV